jgi:hypothetical protein
MKYIFAVIASLSVAWAQTVPHCPPESILVEFISPITGGKKAFCGYVKDGVTIKHGEEWSFDRSGVLIKKLQYQHGVEGAVLAPTYNIPGTEEAAIGSETKILDTIGELLQILTLKKSNIGKGMFKVKGCDSRPADWLKGAMFNSPVQKSYMFGEACDVKGSFTANFMQEFPMSLDLRNLQDFTKTNMTLKMSINKSPQGIRYLFDVLDGFISAPTRNANFRVQYEVDINPMTGEANKSSQKGKVFLTKVNGKEVKAEAALMFDN